MEENKKTTKTMNLYQKLSAITEELGVVAKNLSVGTGKSQYKAVGEADVLSAVKPLEVKYGVYSYPVNRNIIESNILTTTSSFDGNTTEKKQLFMRIETIYRFVNIDNPSEFIDVTTYGDGVDSQDKAPGKAMTYADKYALLKAYKIQTGDDPDQSASEQLKDVTRQPKETKNPVTEDQLKEIKELKVIEANVLKKYRIESLSELTFEQAAFIIRAKKKAIESKGE
jgi:hypothetical protein